jgi:hypothetical protein
MSSAALRSIFASRTLSMHRISSFPRCSRKRSSGATNGVRGRKSGRPHGFIARSFVHVATTAARRRAAQIACDAPNDILQVSNAAGYCSHRDRRAGRETDGVDPAGFASSGYSFCWAARRATDRPVPGLRVRHRTLVRSQGHSGNGRMRCVDRTRGPKRQCKNSSALGSSTGHGSGRRVLHKNVTPVQ